MTKKPTNISRRIHIFFFFFSPSILVNYLLICLGFFFGGWGGGVCVKSKSNEDSFSASNPNSSICLIGLMWCSFHQQTCNKDDKEAKPPFCGPHTLSCHLFFPSIIVQSYLVKRVFWKKEKRKKENPFLKTLNLGL